MQYIKSTFFLFIVLISSSSFGAHVSPDQAKMTQAQSLIDKGKLGDFFQMYSECSMSPTERVHILKYFFQTVRPPLEKLQVQELAQIVHWFYRANQLEAIEELLNNLPTAWQAYAPFMESIKKSAHAAEESRAVNRPKIAPEPNGEDVAMPQAPKPKFSMPDTHPYEMAEIIRERYQKHAFSDEEIRNKIFHDLREYPLFYRWLIYTAAFHIKDNAWRRSDMLNALGKSLLQYEVRMIRNVCLDPMVNTALAVHKKIFQLYNHRKARNAHAIFETLQEATPIAHDALKLIAHYAFEYPLGISLLDALSDPELMKLHPYKLLVDVCNSNDGTFFLGSLSLARGLLSSCAFLKDIILDKHQLRKDTT